MRRRILATGATLVMLALLVAIPAASAGGSDPKMLEFDTMVGVPVAFTGATNPVREINGGGLPWAVEFAKGELTTSGRLEIEVQGLTLDPNDPTVIERGLAGVNPSATFRGVVSCLTAAGGTTNVSTAAFPATTGLGGGDAKIEAQLSLPSPCLAPIVFVTSGGGAWFAVTGS